MLLACQLKNGQPSSGEVSVSASAHIMERVENNILPLKKEGEIQEPQPQTVLNRMGEYGIHGVSIAVFDNNEIVWAKGYGVSDKSSEEAVDTTTVLQAASISKPVTSVGAFRLIEEGKMNLYEDVNLQLKRWQIPINGFTSEQKVTPARIMSHMSGLSTPGFVGYYQGAELPSLREIVEGGPLSNSDPIKVL